MDGGYPHPPRRSFDGRVIDPGSLDIGREGSFPLVSTGFSPYLRNSWHPEQYPSLPLWKASDGTGKTEARRNARGNGRRKRGFSMIVVISWRPTPWYSQRPGTLRTWNPSWGSFSEDQGRFLIPYRGIGDITIHRSWNRHSSGEERPTAL